MAATSASMTVCGSTPLLLGDLGDRLPVTQRVEQLVFLDADRVGGLVEHRHPDGEPPAWAPRSEVGAVLGAGLLQRVGDGVGLSLGDGPVVDQAVEGAVDPAVTVVVVVLGRGAERADGEEAGTEHGGAAGEQSLSWA